MKSQTLKQTIKCEKCQDTYWIQTNNGYKKCDCIHIEISKNNWLNFGIKHEEVKKIADYIPTDSLTASLKAKAVNYIKNFKNIKSDRENSFGILGQSGSGKSHISIAVGAALLSEGFKVIYMPYLEVMRELKANAMDQENYIKVLSKYQRADVLIIDDLFKDKVQGGKLIASLTEADMKHIYPIINFRYLNRLPVLFSSECTAEMLEKLDEALAGRIIESCGDNITTLKGKQYNYRMRKLRSC